jgi:uncharacterized protein YnzC (UPF0291/DUF896 family)
MTVESEFKQGKFEQTLSLIRMPDSMIDSTASASTPSSGAVVSTATSNAQSDTVPGVKPAAAVANSPVAQDATLTGIANGSATSPVPAVAGAGTTAAADQPSTAAAANVNNTQVNIQETPTPDNTVAIQEVAAIEKELKLLDREQDSAISNFNSGLRKIVLNDELTQVEKDKQVLAYRVSYLDTVNAIYSQYIALIGKIDGVISKLAPGKVKTEAQLLRITLGENVKDIRNSGTNNIEAIKRLQGR